MPKFYKIGRVHCTDGTVLQDVTAVISGDFLVIDRGPERNPDWLNLRGVDWLEDVAAVQNGQQKLRTAWI